jgi:lysophospholipid acyltransferase (LPLAT)-like uncharacterized protein
MSFKKRLLKNERTQGVLSWLLSLYIRLVFLTARLVRRVDSDAEQYLRGDDNAIFAFWHGRMMLLPSVCPPKRQMRVLISLHRDGSLISRTIGHFGQKTVSGSTSRGGQAAVMEMLRALESGDNISITPDGPRGPAQIAAPGIASVAKLSGKPVLPVTFSARSCRRLKSWDRFMLAYPFSRIAFCVGKPILVGTDDDEEQARLVIERAMNVLVETADGIVHA